MNNITMEFARQDDCLDKMVPSDLRILVGQRDIALDRDRASAKIIAELIVERDRLKSREKFFIDEIKNQQKTIDDYRITKFARFNNEECWVYDEDIGDDNHLESLVCPVVIRAKYLQSLIKDNYNKNQSTLAIQARRNILYGLIMRILEGDELIASDWDYISDNEYQEIKKVINKIKTDAIKELKFPTMLRQMWSGGDVQVWLENHAKFLEQK